MTMTRKRPNLAEFEASAERPRRGATAESNTNKTVHKSVYIPTAVLDQLDLLALRSDLLLEKKEIQHFCP